MSQQLKKNAAPIYFKNIFLLTLFSLLTLMYSCNSAESETADDPGTADNVEPVVDTTAVTSDANAEGLPQVQIPESYDVLAEATGDLDGDGIDEKVVVFNTDREGEMGTERELRIYAEHDGLWSLWHTSIGPVLSSERGGMMGDPFESISISNGQIEISHYGGSSDRWSYNHEFKLVDDQWTAMSATLHYFRVCDFSETYTYDFVKLTGYHSRQKDACNENGEQTSSKIEVEENLTLKGSAASTKMDDFKPGDTEIHVNEDNELYYF